MWRYSDFKAAGHGWSQNRHSTSLRVQRAEANARAVFQLYITFCYDSMLCPGTAWNDLILRFRVLSCASIVLDSIIMVHRLFGKVSRPCTKYMMMSLCRTDSVLNKGRASRAIVHHNVPIRMNPQQGYAHAAYLCSVETVASSCIMHTFKNHPMITHANNDILSSVSDCSSLLDETALWSFRLWSRKIHTVRIICKHADTNASFVRMQNNARESTPRLVWPRRK